MNGILLNRMSRFCLVVLMMTTSFGVLSGQAHDYLFHPSFYDQYLKMQVLPDSTVRVFVVADQSNGWTNPRIVYADFSADSLKADQVPVPITQPGEYINSLVYTPFVLRCADGSIVIASNFFDCDYGGADAIYKLNADGQVAWSYSFWDAGDLTEILQVAFSDSNIISVASYNDNFSFNLADGMIQQVDPPVIFDHSAQTSFGYLCALGDSLIILDPSFEPLQIYLLEGDILSIDDVRINEFQITTTEGYYQLKEDLQVYSLPFSNEEFSPVWSAAASFWGFNVNEGLVMRFDTFFNPLDTFQMPPGISPVAGIPLENEVLVLKAYENQLSQGVVAFQDQEDSIDFKLPQDIGITDISMLDTVLVEFFNWSAPNPGWVYHIPELTITVENFGPDTVTDFFLQAHASLECFWWCISSSPFWSIDSLRLAPGASSIVRIDPFVTHCGNEFNPEICLSTVAPDRKADGNYLNDKFCRSFDFVLETNEQVEDKGIMVYPNPASDKIYFHVDQPGLDDLTCTIFDATGNAVDQFKQMNQGYSIKDHPPGIYLLMVTDQEGIVGYQRIVKANQ